MGGACCGRAQQQAPPAAAEQHRPAGGRRHICSWLQARLEVGSMRQQPDCSGGGGSPDSTSYACATALNRSSASGLSGLRSGWYRLHTADECVHENGACGNSLQPTRRRQAAAARGGGTSCPARHATSKGRRALQHAQGCSTVSFLNGAVVSVWRHAQGVIVLRLPHGAHRRRPQQQQASRGPGAPHLPLWAAGFQVCCPLNRLKARKTSEAAAAKGARACAS